MKATVDTLWLIDGHHDVFKSRDHLIPSSFQDTTNHNYRKHDSHALPFMSVRMHCLDAYKESIGSNLAGRGLNLMLYY